MFVHVGARLDISSSHKPGALFPDGETSVFYTATDASGNNRTCEIIITVQGMYPDLPLAYTSIFTNNYFQSFVRLKVLFKFYKKKFTLE